MNDSTPSRAVLRLVVGATCLAAFLLVAAACTSAPGSRTFQGSWTGTMNDRVALAGIARVTLGGSGRTLSGTWEATFEQGVLSGEVLGVAVEEVAALVMYVDQESGCSLQADVQRVGSQLIGEYTADGCTGASRGDLVLGPE